MQVDCHRESRLSGKCAFSFPLFFLGLFSETQVMIIGSIGISEFCMFILGPIFLCMDWMQLRQKKFAGFLCLLALMFVSGICSNQWNHIPFASAIRGLATPYSFFMGVVTFHHFLKGDIKKTRWFFVGLMLSTILSVFIFQRGANKYVGGYEVSSAEAMANKMNYSLFWLQQFIGVFSMPINAFYLELPKAYPICAVLFLLYYGFAQSNNRSSLIIFGGSLFLLLVGGKRSPAMQFVKKYFLLLVISMFFVAPLVNFLYKGAAQSGMLGEKARAKYEKQVGNKADFLQTLMAGRSDFFIGLTACLDRPIIGFGAWAQDTYGYTISYFAKHDATENDLAMIKWDEEHRGLLIPGHSWVIQSWLWYGIGGLIWALAAGKLIFTTLKNCLGSIPHLYGYFALVLPANCWNWFFSPLGGRTSMAFFFTLCLFAQYYQRQKDRGLLA